ncbi:MAG TPA: choice-of-anchor tandem repeat GloVer-containing protein [Rhizomicrobium sp.]|jgi:uncharacterized repeat protein (TIGR03803 family)|nr:choice-of-anchor tandem repeat GloVer-containing protein [Rhizomicrobium sp.]
MFGIRACVLSACSLLACSVAAMPASADSLKVIHTFVAVKKGARPRAALTSDSTGALYGTTYTGAADGNGTVFSLSRSGDGSKKWVQTVLHHFSTNVKNGIYPDSSVILDAQGNLYGTTSEGGTNDAGVVFELVRPANEGDPWKEIVLHRFTGGSDGGTPHGTLVFGADGDLYGTAGYGGTSGAGLVFRLSLRDSGHWKETVLFDFGNDAGGGYPYSRPIFDAAGNLYGTTLNGGNTGNGVVFELSAPAGGGGGPWTETVLHSFDAADDGVEPRMGVIMDAAGNLYGTTESGGSVGYGAIFEVSPPAGQGQAWTETVLYSFGFSPDGGSPAYSGLVMDDSGNLYGTTQTGGTLHNGVVFALAPPAQQGGSWTESVLHTFADSPDGAQPEAGLTFGAGGLLFGTTFMGGTTNESGTVFKVKP